MVKRDEKRKTNDLNIKACTKIIYTYRAMSTDDTRQSLTTTLISSVLTMLTKTKPTPLLKTMPHSSQNDSLPL